MLRKMMLLTTLTLAALLLGACGASFDFNPFTAEETVTQSFNTDGTTHLVVEMFNGGVDVVASDAVTGGDNFVKVDVVKRGGGFSQQEAQDDLKNVEVTMQQDGSTIRVVARRTDQRVDIGNSGASARLRVPAGTTLDLRASNGAITSAGAVGSVKADTSNGAIDVRGAAGPLNLVTSNGAVTIDGGSGSLNAETSNGAINVTAENVTFTGRTSNGFVRFNGTLAPGRSQLDTSNGGIVVTLPGSAQFLVNADTSNAKINSEFAVTAQNFSDNELHGTVGVDPAVSLELHTSNGGINLRKSE